MEQAKRDWVAQLTSTDSVTRENAAGDLRAFLVRGLKSAFLKRGVDEAFCEDIAQDATIKVLQQIGQFQGRSQLTTWAMTIAIRLAINEFRRKKFKDVSLEGMSGEDSLRIDVSSPEVGPETNVARKALLKKLMRLVEGLSDKQRLATEALLGGMPVEIIAEKTGSNRNAVYKLIHDARRSLKKGFEQAGYDWQDIHSALGAGN